MKKKAYTAPSMKVMLIDSRVRLLAGSSYDFDLGNVPDYKDGPAA